MNRKAIVFASVILTFAVLVFIWTAQHNPKPIRLIPKLTGEPEYCLTCHYDLPEISQSHPTQTFGCVICHGGEALALNSELAHSTMRGGRNPSDLEVVEASCGGKECHAGTMEEQSDHIHRVMTSLHSTYAGAIVNFRYTFGMQADLKARLGIRAVQDDVIESTNGRSALIAVDIYLEKSSLEEKFYQNCLDCHLSAPPRTGKEFERLTGCAACHTPTAGKDLAAPLHKLTTAIPYTQCNTCHNRGTFELKSLTFTPRENSPVNNTNGDDLSASHSVRCVNSLDCIDCHTYGEAMGDGDIHSLQAETPSIQCQTCHGTIAELPRTHRIDGADNIAMRLAFFNRLAGETWKLKPGDLILITNNGEPLWNTRLQLNGSYELFRKVTGKIVPFRPVKGSNCAQKIDEQKAEYCQTCHREESE